MQFRTASTALAFALSVSAAAVPAHADTWACEVLLCMSNPAGPTAVSQCVPPITRLWKHLAKGHGWPFCDMGGDANQAASNEWASAQNCPPQYVKYANSNDAQIPYCTYTGVITIKQAGEPYVKVWWTPGGVSVTENLNPTAPVNEASERFMNDYAVWKIEQDELARIRAEQGLAQYSN